MKRVECGRGISELISEKWEHKKIGLYYCFEKNNKIYIPFGNCIEIYDKSEYVKLYGDEISEEEHKELSNNPDNKLTQFKRIKAMNSEELAEFLMDWATDFCEGKAPMNVYLWLESEVIE